MAKSRTRKAAVRHAEFSPRQIDKNLKNLAEFMTHAGRNSARSLHQLDEEAGKSSRVNSGIN